MLRRLFLKTLEKISRITSKIYVPYTRKLITGKDIKDLSKHLKKGDIVLTKTNGELSNWGIPGFFSHVAIAHSPDFLIESATRGVSITDTISFCLNKDFIVVMTPRFACEEKRNMAAEIAFKQIGKPYDFSFATSDIRSFYCSELVYYAYSQACKSMPFLPRKIFGRDTIAPDDFWRSEQFRVKWVSESYKKGQ